MGRGTFVLLFVLVLVGAVPRLDAQGWNCATIRPGDTAWSVAARMTGSSTNRHAASFRIVEPGSGRVVPKSRYARIRAGWLACVAQRTTASNPISGTSSDPSSDTKSGTSLGTLSGTRSEARAAVNMALSRIANGLRAIDSPILVFGLLAAAVAFLWSGCDEYFRERRKRLRLMQVFGERFVREFERPLLERRVGPAPVRARLHAHPGSGRLDVWLAPNAGRRYPNLSDHKDNVDYDIARVSQLLQDPSFVCATPYAQAGWVVIPFQFQHRPGQAGGP
jgi:hypothetical protein